MYFLKNYYFKIYFTRKMGFKHDVNGDVDLKIEEKSNPPLDFLKLLMQ